MHPQGLRLVVAAQSNEQPRVARGTVAAVSVNPSPQGTPARTQNLNAGLEGMSPTWHAHQAEPEPMLAAPHLIKQ